jgi:WD40 repeat protein
VTGLRFNGGRLVTAAADGVVRSWDLDTGTGVIIFDAKKVIDAIALSRDGATLLVACEETTSVSPGEAIVMDPWTGAVRGELPVQDAPCEVALSEHGEVAAIMFGYKLVTWEVATGRTHGSDRTAGRHGSGWRWGLHASRHRIFATCDEGYVAVDPWTHSLLGLTPAGPSLALADDERLAAIRGRHNAVSVVALPGGRELWRRDLAPDRPEVQCLCGGDHTDIRFGVFSDDDRLLALICEGRVRTYDASSGDELGGYELPRAVGAASLLRFSPDGGRLIVGTESGVVLSLLLGERDGTPR